MVTSTGPIPWYEVFPYWKLTSFLKNPCVYDSLLLLLPSCFLASAPLLSHTSLPLVVASFSLAVSACLVGGCIVMLPCLAVCVVPPSLCHSNALLYQVLLYCIITLSRRHVVVSLRIVLPSQLVVATTLVSLLSCRCLVLSPHHHVLLRLVVSSMFGFVCLVFALHLDILSH
jgi:hypothetical protein